MGWDRQQLTDKQTALLNNTELSTRVESSATDSEIITLPIELTNGNEGRTKHFGASAKRRKQYEIIIRSLYPNRVPPDYMQRVTFIRVLGQGQRLYDPDSGTRGNAKEICDAMTVCGFWHDDSAKWLEYVHFEQDASERKQPYIRVRIERSQK